MSKNYLLNGHPTMFACSSKIISSLGQQKAPLPLELGDVIDAMQELITSLHLIPPTSAGSNYTSRPFGNQENLESLAVYLSCRFNQDYSVHGSYNPFLHPQPPLNQDAIVVFQEIAERSTASIPGPFSSSQILQSTGLDDVKFNAAVQTLLQNQLVVTQSVYIELAPQAILTAWGLLGHDAAAMAWTFLVLLTIPLPGRIDLRLIYKTLGWSEPEAYRIGCFLDHIGLVQATHNGLPTFGFGFYKITAQGLGLINNTRPIIC